MPVLIAAEQQALIPGLNYQDPVRLAVVAIELSNSQFGYYLEMHPDKVAQPELSTFRFVNLAASNAHHLTQ